jgi:hypothetical protein
VTQAQPLVFFVLLEYCSTTEGARVAQ